MNEGESHILYSMKAVNLTYETEFKSQLMKPTLHAQEYYTKQVRVIYSIAGEWGKLID